MPTETAISEATTITNKAVKEGINLVKKAWSIMDAASEKKQPSDYLSPKTISSIQGS